MIALRWLFCLMLVYSAQLHGQDTLHFVFLNSNPDRVKLEPDAATTLQKGHLANIDRLYRKGKIRAAGPFADGGGFFIISASDSVELDTLLRSDPAIRANRFILETWPLQLLHGKLCKASEPFAMDTVAFIRINRLAQGSNTSLASIPGQFFTQSGVLLAGAWKGAGGFVVGTSGNPDFEQWLVRLKQLSNGKATCHRRTLWYGKGTFCQ